MKKWEHISFAIRETAEEFLKREEAKLFKTLEPERWELVSVISFHDAHRVFYFKREKIEEAKPIEAD